MATGKQKKTNTPKRGRAEKNAKNTKQGKTHAEEDHESLGADYWNRVAEDVASGYKHKEDKDSVLNEDQMADDHERGDKTIEGNQETTK